jgi:catechol 2,3-dioxygenase-like lactoylglutathione lyase family enzyme
MPRFEAIGVAASDLERSAAFYGELGLEFPDPLDPEGHGHVEASLPGGLRFMLDTEEVVKSFDPEWSPPSGSGHRVSLAFRCDSPADVDAVCARMLESGGTPSIEPWDAEWGQRYAELKDPDGNVVHLFAALEG